MNTLPTIRLTPDERDALIGLAIAIAKHDPGQTLHPSTTHEDALSWDWELQEDWLEYALAEIDRNPRVVNSYGGELSDYDFDIVQRVAQDLTRSPMLVEAQAYEIRPYNGETGLARKISQRLDRGSRVMELAMEDHFHDFAEIAPPTIRFSKNGVASLIYALGPMVLGLLIVKLLTFSGIASPQQGHFMGALLIFGGLIWATTYALHLQAHISRSIRHYSNSSRTFS